MTDHDIRNAAMARGFTQAIYADGGAVDLELWVSPDADLDGTFPAICRDTGELLRVNGWLFAIETI